MFDVPAVSTVAVVVGAVSMIGGNILALLQTNIKRLLAYSSIAHIGYLVIALVVAGAGDSHVGLGVEAALMYLTGYFAMTLAAFGVVTALSRGDEEAEELSSYEGLLWRQPVLAAVLIAAMLSLAGIPLTVGFIAKFYLVAAGVEGAAWTLVWALIIGSAIGVYYYLRVVFAVTKRATPDAVEVRPAWESVTTVAALGVVIVVLGVYVQPLMEFLRQHSWHPW